MIKAIIFDCFGVLITDALEILRADLVTTQPDKAAQIEDTITASNRGFLDPTEAIRRLAELSGRTPEDVGAAIEQDEVIDTRLLDYIMQLRGSGYKIGLLSNIVADGLTRRFTPAVLDEHFDAVVASGAVGYAKPEPEAYEITADRLGVRLEECLMVDDRQVCVDGALAVGMRGIRYETYDQFVPALAKVLA
jgi:HAD superfamily hydrolase (TIGR01509 family)